MELEVDEGGEGLEVGEMFFVLDQESPFEGGEFPFFEENSCSNRGIGARGWAQDQEGFFEEGTEEGGLEGGGVLEEGVEAVLVEGVEGF